MNKGCFCRFCYKAAVLLLLFVPLFGQSKLEQEYAELLEKYEELNTRKWKEKEEMLKGRSRLDDELNLLEERTRTLYIQRNSLIEEIYLKKESTASLAELYKEETLKEERLKIQVEDAAEKERKKLSGMPQELINDAVPKLNRIKDLSDQFSSEPLRLLDSYLAYKLFLIEQAETVSIGERDLLLNNEQGAERVRLLQAGYVFGGISFGGGSAMLLRIPSLTGIEYQWRPLLSGSSLSMRVDDAVNKAMADAGSGGRVELPFDVAQSGEKLQGVGDKSDSSGMGAVLSFIEEGGVLMYPLILIALFALIIVGERLYFYRKNSFSYREPMERICRAIAAGRRSEALEMCSEVSLPAASLVKTVLEKSPQERSAAENLLEENAVGSVPRFEKRLATLAVLAAIAPLLGLLGTVSGMIQLFDVITLYGTNNPKILAGGISVALITTQTGLGIAIPIMMCHHLLVRWKSRILGEMEKHVIALLNAFPADKKHSTQSIP